MRAVSPAIGAYSLVGLVNRGFSPVGRARSAEVVKIFC